MAQFKTISLYIKILADYNRYMHPYIKLTTLCFFATLSLIVSEGMFAGQIYKDPSVKDYSQSFCDAYQCVFKHTKLARQILIQLKQLPQSYDLKKFVKKQVMMSKTKIKRMKSKVSKSTPIRKKHDNYFYSAYQIDRKPASGKKQRAWVFEKYTRHGQSVIAIRLVTGDKPVKIKEALALLDRFGYKD